MTQALTTMKDGTVDILEKVLIGGDLSKLTSAERLSFYKSTCDSLGLNSLTKPFDYITLNGKLTLYARKDATEQLRKIHEVSIDPKTFTREVTEGIYVVTATASVPTGRTDVSIGAVSIEGLKGEARANAMMKAETKAKRRVTLSICGLGMLDETEVETIPEANPFEEPRQLPLKPPPVQDAPTSEVEMQLAKSCLMEVMKTECFTEEDRINCDLWLKKARPLSVIKKKLRDKQEWVEAWKKEKAAENQDADTLVQGSQAF